MSEPDHVDVARMIDHALLSPTLTTRELTEGCLLAREKGVASVCILPYWLARAAAILEGSDVKASTTIGFPHGGQATLAKIDEAKRALDDGGEELDMVVNISAVLSGELDYVRTEIEAITRVCHDVGRKVKVIFENCYLSDEQKIALCHISSEAGADWVKTSTGFGPSGATLPDVALMRAHAAASVQVKASGGIRDLDTVLALRALGATRVGASRTLAILDEARQRLPSG